ncbi:MAG: hypothetical protein ACWA5R_05460 [bacterium]
MYLELESVSEFLNKIRGQITSCKIKDSQNLEAKTNFTRVVNLYSQGFALKDTGSAAMYLDKKKKTIFLNKIMIENIINQSGKYSRFLVVLFSIHEVLHVTQGVGSYLSVRNLYRTNSKWTMSYLDLRSTTMAINLARELSDLLHVNEICVTNSPKRHSIDIHSALLCGMSIFKAGDNAPKIKRYIGKMLMIHFCIKNKNNWCNKGKHLTVWPEWSKDYSYLTLFTNDFHVLSETQKISSNMEKLICNVKNNLIEDAYHLTGILADEININEDIFGE